MPELLEVNDLVKSISRKIKGTTIRKVDILSGRYTRKQPTGITAFRNKLPLKVKDIKSKGKFIYIELEKDSRLRNTVEEAPIIFITLGLTGDLEFSKPESDSEQHDRIVFITSSGKLYFNDQRNFGTVKFTDTKELDKKLKQLGLDPQKDSFDFATFEEQFESKLARSKVSQKIGDFLINQKFIAGIGNMLRSEVLYEAGIDPRCKIDQFDTSLLKDLHSAIVKIVKRGGKEMSTKGHWTTKVYKKETDPKGNKVDSLIMKDKRKIWWVPKLQKKC